MKISAIRDDNVVIVDGVARKVAWSSALPEGWSAVQWQGNAGLVEFSQPRKVERTDDAGLATLLKALWDAGGKNLGTPAAADDVVATARAKVLDSFIVQAAQAVDAPDFIKAAAAQIGDPGVAIDLSTGGVTQTKGGVDVQAQKG